MAISENDVTEVLIRSARHCCVCRNFLPLKIQVHHIVKGSDGGTDDLDNLIPICIQCHSDIHTITQMTRKFTVKELKKCRDIVYEMVACGKLPAKIPITKNELYEISSILTETLNSKSDNNLSHEAIELLSTALCENSPISLFSNAEIDLIRIHIGSQQFTKRKSDSKYPTSIIELLSKGLIEFNDNQFEITEKGTKLVSELVQNTSTYTQKKVKCLECGLHFILCTWDIERHNSSSICCPECGQNNGSFLVWTQQKFGFIFQDVPGNSTLFDGPR